MAPSAVLLVALLTSTLVSSAPAPETQKGFSVRQISTGRRKVGVVEYKKALLKHAGYAPSHVHEAAAAAQSGSVTASSVQDDEEYVCPVTIGGQQLTLDFDTGSSDLWVFSSETPSSEVNGQTVWQTSHGTLQSGLTWSISYGDGSSASGNVYDASVVVGGVTASSQAVEAAKQVSSEFSQDSSSDGLMGLGFKVGNQVSPTKQNTFFENVQSSLPQPIFAAALKYHAAGVYDFGFIDSSKYTGSLVYTSVDSSEGYWAFTASGTSAGGSSISSIADTGTTLILLNDNLVSAYYSKVSGASNSQAEGGWIFPCSTTPPDFTVTIAGSTFTVPGTYINFGTASGSQCYGGIQSNQGIGLNIFGDVFLKAMYVVFDGGQTRLGFAQQAGVSGSGGGSSPSQTGGGGSQPTQTGGGGSSPTSPGSGYPTGGYPSGGYPTGLPTGFSYPSYSNGGGSSPYPTGSSSSPYGNEGSSGSY